MNGRSTMVAALLALGLAAVAAAQEAPPDSKKPEAARAEEPKPESSARRVPTVPLRVTVLISRFEGEKKLASIPYTFIVTAGGRPVALRTGLEMPVPDAPDGTAPEVKYQHNGTNIDCDATDLGDGRFQLDLSVEFSSAESAPTVRDRPLLRRFHSRLTAMLRDGQTLQAISSTDPVTGSTVKVDVSLHVVR